jgi:hypothetical protein
MAAVILQILLVVYHQVTTWLDLFPFNGVRFYSRREQVTEALVNFVLMGLPPVGFCFHVPSLMKFGVVYYFALLVIEGATWWAPYLFGASPKWAEMHARLHGQTVTIIPKRAGHPAPNLEHLILMLLTAATAFATLPAFRALNGPSKDIWLSVGVVSAVFGGGTFYQFVLAGRFSGKAGPARGA